MAKRGLGNWIDLFVSNYKGLKELHVRLVPGAATISGKNGAGKSSALDAVANAIGGKKLSPAKPVKDGEKGYICRLGFKALGIVVERVGTLREDGTLREELIVSDASGFRATSPQDMLDKLFAGVGAVRAEAFAELPAKDQVATLRAISGLDFSEIDKQRATTYDARRDANAVVRNLKGQLAGMQAPPDSTPRDAVNVVELAKELEKAGAHNREIESHKIKLEKARKDAETAQQRVSAAAKAHVDAVAAAEQSSQLVADYAAAVESAVEIDTEPLRTKLDAATAINLQAEADRKWATVQGDIIEAESKATALDKAIIEIDATKAKMLSESKLPVAGLGFTDDGVTLNDRPLSQSSQAEQMFVSVKVGVALSPKVPLILVREASLLDAAHMKALDELAQECGAFVLAERVMDTDDGVTTVYLSEGEAVAVRSPVQLELEDEAAAEEADA
jgi:ribonuclease HI